ncbi:MAG TPA: uroporphyrinogen-III synthase [Verrucomicrobiae bacterium]|nr:uroporphyrinogen-III synthase [Verrucomicrobiae bacterium]
MSLAGKRVVVTRAAEQSEALVKALEEQGAVPVVVPMVAFAPPEDSRALDEVIREVGRYDWLFLTSQNALRALQERGESLGIRLAGAGKLKIAAVGPATAEAAEHAGLHVEYVAVKHQGTAMAEELGERVRGSSVLLPRSDRANPELVEKLKELGANVKEVVAYKTVQPDDEGTARARQMLNEDATDAVLFFSPSAVHHLQQIVGVDNFQKLAKHALFAAIGPVTEKALQQAKAERVAMARDTTVGAVIGILQDYFSANMKLPAGANPE